MFNRLKEMCKAFAYEEEVKAYKLTGKIIFYAIGVVTIVEMFMK